MAIKRDNYGKIIIQEFENHLKSQLRNEGYLEIIMYVPDSRARIATINSNDILEYNGNSIIDISSIGDIKRYTNTTIATLEENLWLLDGRFINYQGDQLDGYISNSISNSNGVFTTNPVITVGLASAINAESFSIMLNPAVPTGYPKQIKLTCYDTNNQVVKEITKDIEWQEPSGEVDEDDQPIMITKLLDTLPSVNFDINTQNVYNVNIEFIGTRLPHRRIRVSNIMFGRTIYIDTSKVLNVDYIDKTSFVPDTIPSRKFTFTLENYKGNYNIDNPNNGYVSLEKNRTRVQFRTGYNVAGYEYNNDGTVKMVDDFPVMEREPGVQEIEWDDWKELRLMNIDTNADESVSFECGSVLDTMEDTYTQEQFDGYERTIENIASQILSFEGLDSNTIEWSSDGIKVPKYVDGVLQPYETWEDTEYKQYKIGTPLPEVPCKQIIQLLAFACGATLLIKDNGKIKFANLNLNNPNSFTRQFDWTYKQFESIPAAQELNSIQSIEELSMPKYRSWLVADGDIEFDGWPACSVIGTCKCSAITNEVTYSECLPFGYRLKEGSPVGPTPQQGSLYCRRGIIRVGGLQEGQSVDVEIIGYKVETQEIQERNVTSDSLVLNTQILYKDVPSYQQNGQVDSNHKEMIKEKYLEWYKKKFKYTIQTRGEPLVNAGDYGRIQTQFSQQLNVFILQNHWTFDGAFAGDMEVISLE